MEVEDDKIVLKPIIKRGRNPLEELLSLVKEPLDVDVVKLVEESWSGN